MLIHRPLGSLAALICCGLLLAAEVRAQSPEAVPVEQGRTVLKTTVRRVVLDVVVTDSKGAPVAGLTKDDFTVKEDGVPQRVLSFDTNGFSADMDYFPPKLPSMPANTFTDMPSTPEKGPLYVLLYDMVNLDDPTQQLTPEDHSQQIIARRQMLQFIQSKPEGTRFAVFVRSDGVYLIQGFTADKNLLYAALDPKHPRPHVPIVFLMGDSYGRANRLGALDVLHRISMYLDGLPGRKNLIWFSSIFPLSLFPDEADGPNFQQETKETLALMAHNQIAIYPVDARGVPAQDAHQILTTSVHSPATGSPLETAPAQVGGNGVITTAGSATGGGGPVQGASAVGTSFNVMDAIALETGGQAFYGDNAVAAELTAATQSGGSFYTLTYAPRSGGVDDKVRRIEVELGKKGYTLAYRRSYYDVPPEPRSADAAMVTPALKTSGTLRAGQSASTDSLGVEMEHGAPALHQLVFVVQATQAGAPEQATAAEMAELATEPAYFKSRRRSTIAKPLPPVPLQRHIFNFEIPTRQFAGEAALDLEIAAAAYDADGRLMNGFVRLAKKELGAGGAMGEGARFFRVEQALAVPVGASSIRLAVRDTVNDRMGVMELPLPLAPAVPATPDAAH